MAVLKYRNQFLDRINVREIITIHKYNSMDGRICPYGITIDFKDGSIEQYEYYQKWQRNKDFLNLNIYIKRKEDNNDDKRIACTSEGCEGEEERTEFTEESDFD